MMAVKRYSQYSVLITGEDETTRDELRSHLEPEGYDTVPAQSGLEAIRIVKRGRIHVGIFEMQMPDMTGVEAIEIIRETVEAPPPCILVSRKVTKELMLRALCARAHTLLAKPLNHGLMQAVLEELIRRTYLDIR
ncbi:MAG: response regulator [Planctomycetes bacterium]|nr:response regulator [Planctomycetota bacterium]